MIFWWKTLEIGKQFQVHRLIWPRFSQCNEGCERSNKIKTILTKVHCCVFFWQSFKVARAGTALLTMTPRAVLPFQDRNFQTPKLSKGYKCWTQEHKNVDCRMHACIVKKLISSIENLFYFIPFTSLLNSFLHSSDLKVSFLLPSKPIKSIENWFLVILDINFITLLWNCFISFW